MALGDPFSGGPTPMWSDKWMPFYTPGRQFASDRGPSMFQMPAPPGSLGLADLNLNAGSPGLPTPTAGGTSGVGEETPPSTLPSDISNVLSTAARGTRSLSGGDSSTPSGEGIGLGDVSNALSGLGGAANLAGGIALNRPAQAVGGGLQLAGAGARAGGLSDIGTAAGGVGGLLGLEEGIRGLATGTATPAQAVLPIASGALSTAGAANALFPGAKTAIGNLFTGGAPTAGEGATGLGEIPGPSIPSDVTGLGGDISSGIGGLGGLYNISTAIKDLLSGQGNGVGAGSNLGSGLLNVYTTVANMFPDLSLPTINSLISSAVSSLTGTAGGGTAGATTGLGTGALSAVAPDILSSGADLVGSTAGALGAEGAGSGGAALGAEGAGLGADLAGELGGLGAGLGAGAVVAAPFIFSAVARALGAGGLDISDFWGGGAEGGDFAGVSKARGQLRTRLGDEAAQNFAGAQQAGQSYQDALSKGVTDPAQLTALGNQLMQTATSYYTPLEEAAGNPAVPGLGSNSGLGQSSTPQGLTPQGQAPFNDALMNAMKIDQYLRATGHPGLDVPPDFAAAAGFGVPTNQANYSSQGADFVPQYDPALGPPPTDPAQLQNYYRQAMTNRFGAPQQPYLPLTPEQLAVANRAQYTYTPPPQAVPAGLGALNAFTMGGGP